ncbi:MAG: hypothetical protein ABF697_09090 [Zymomonas mobilis]|uniref:hypothetical protein n=1 Tax=Zymomonas mobilis TaxID=542 RepID=UPI0039ED3062
MAKKPTGLAAFSRPKTATHPLTEEPSFTIENQTAFSPRKKRGSGDTVALTVKVRRTDWQRLRQLADAEGTTIQAMAEAGFSAILAQHGLAPLATRK